MSKYFFEHEHRDAEHEHDEEPEQSDPDEGLDRSLLSGARVSSLASLIAAADVDTHPNCPSHDPLQTSTRVWQ
jgi:hypothetical protein